MLNRLKKFIAKKPKTSLSVITGLIAAAVLIPILATAGYGPNRPTYDWNKYNANASCTDPSNANGKCGSMNGPVFDSFINTPSYGDEENFNTIAPVVAGQSPTNASYSETSTATPGNEYWVRTLVHNDANQNLNCLPEHRSQALNNCTQIDPGSPSIATGTKFHLEIAQGQANGVDIETYISADNATPNLIWDTSTLKNNNQAFEVSYVPGSATIYNGAHPGGLALPDSVNSANGTLIGYNQMDGVIPGCFDYSSYVYFKVQVKSPQLTVKKQVRSTAPNSTWSSSMNANSGDTVQWRITYQNSGSAVDHNVTIRDQLPKDLSIVPGSIKWYDANNDGVVQPDSALGSGGVDVGNYAPVASNQINGMIQFDTTIAKDPSTCTITNTGYGRADNVNEMSSQASVTVSNCSHPQPSPVYACNSLGVTKDGKNVTISNFDETATGGATFEYAIIDWGDLSQNLNTNKVVGSTHTYTKDGSYKITATAYFSVNGQTITPSVNGCVATVSFVTPPVPPIPPVPPTPSTPEQLVNTGPGSVVAAFLASWAVGYGLFRWNLKRKLRINR